MPRSIATPLPPLRRKILRAFVLIVGLYGALAAFVLGAVYFASGITPTVIHLNYDSIQAAAQMQEAWNALHFPDAFPGKRAPQWTEQFERALRFEESNISEPGEQEIAELLRAEWTKRGDFVAVHQALRKLVMLNERAMFAAAESSSQLRRRAFMIGGAIFLLALFAAVWQGDALAMRLSSPLKAIAEALRNKPLPGEKLKLPTPTSLEIRVLTHEMTQLWKRLSELRALNLEEISTQRNKLQVILESVDDGILVIDSFGTVLQCNPGLAQIVGLPIDAIEGHKWIDLATASESYLQLRDRLSPEKCTDHAAFEVKVQGKKFAYAARCRNVATKSGDVSGIVYLLHDVTARREMDQLKAEFFAVLSHELKTPLQSLGTASELLVKRKDRLDEDGQMLVDTIHQDAERIRAVAQDFIQVSFTERHALRLQITRQPLDSLVQEWIKPFRFVAGDKRVRILYAPPAATTWANIDPIKFPWVVSNLLSNAIRFSPPDTTITVALTETDKQVELEIRDEGPGIPAEIRQRMFDPYFQAPSEDAKTPNGFLGLGLTIAKELVEAHRGGIEYVPGSPRGATFRITLPHADRAA